MPNIKMIAAVSGNGGLGLDGKLLYKIPADLKHFKATTEGGIVIMGRTTYEEIGKPLPNRMNIVLTSDKDYPCDCIVMTSIEEAIELCKKYGKAVWVIGGAKVYSQMIDKAEELHLTVITESTVPHADVFFPAQYRDIMEYVGGKEEEVGRYTLDYQTWRKL